MFNKLFRTISTTLILCSVLLTYGCTSEKKKDRLAIGFVEAIEDPTLDQAKEGFFEGLKEGGFSQEIGNIEVIKKNAQGDFTSLVQAIDFLLNKPVDLLATSASITTVTAIKKNHRVPVFMMVAPEPGKAGLLDREGNMPKNLYGVYENLKYIDTSFFLITELMPNIKVLGISYNPAEPQSSDAFNHMKILAKNSGIRLEAVAISNSSETSQALTALTERHIQAFFAMPDNTVFASFELIKKICDSSKIPIFTSEAGLVSRGALCAYGADLFEWGKQSGRLAVKYLSGERKQSNLLEEVKIRRRVFNPIVAKNYTELKLPGNYISVAK